MSELFNMTPKVQVKKTHRKVEQLEFVKIFKNLVKIVFWAEERLVSKIHQKGLASRM